jgi:hypothetical protein
VGGGRCKIQAKKTFIHLGSGSFALVIAHALLLIVYFHELPSAITILPYHFITLAPFIFFYQQ